MRDAGGVGENEMRFAKEMADARERDYQNYRMEQQKELIRSPLPSHSTG